MSVDKREAVLKHDTTPTSWERQEATPLIDIPFEDGLGRTVFIRTHDDNKPGTSARTELHTFCDASEMAIGAVSYLRIIQNTGEVQVTCVLGKAKLTPTHATTIHRLELCAAVLGVELSELINEELHKPDSKVMLSFISNDSRRFTFTLATA